MVALNRRNDDERNEDQPQQRELVGRRPELRDHVLCSALPWPCTTRQKLWPVLPSKRCCNEGISPFLLSSSMRSTRCMGKNTALGVTASPAFTWRAKSSKQVSSIPRRLRPAGV